jgi:hypothetical protein
MLALILLSFKLGSGLTKKVVVLFLTETGSPPDIEDGALILPSNKNFKVMFCSRSQSRNLNYPLPSER